MKKKIGIQVIREITIEVDTDNEIVGEYDSDNDLLSDLVSYKFSNVLPVIQGGGVIILDEEVMDWSSIDK